MTAVHVIAWEISHGGEIQGNLSCHAKPGAPCRVGCDQGCETWDLGDHAHPLVDLGECWVLPWFENTDESLAELYSGHTHSLSDGPVELHWYGEDEFTWHYGAGS